MSTAAAVDRGDDRATRSNPLFRIYSALRLADFIDPLAGQLAVAGTSLIVAAVVVKRPASASVATKFADVQAFASRRPDSNRRPLHYETIALLHTDLALRCPFWPVIPYPIRALFRMHSALARDVSHPTMFSPTADEVALLSPNWALDDVQRHTFACELDGVGVAELVGRGAAPGVR